MTNQKKLIDVIALLPFFHKRKVGLKVDTRLVWELHPPTHGLLTCLIKLRFLFLFVLQSTCLPEVCLSFNCFS